MTPEERIKKLEIELDRAKDENRRWKRAFLQYSEVTDRGGPQYDYITYLRRAVLRLEAMVDERQEIIERYQAHYAKYGHVYKEYEDKVHPQRHPLDTLA